MRQHPRTPLRIFERCPPAAGKSPQKTPSQMAKKTPSSVTHLQNFPTLFSPLLQEEHVLLPYYILGGVSPPKPDHLQPQNQT
jgi:hypothetical protein